MGGGPEVGIRLGAALAVTARGEVAARAHPGGVGVTERHIAAGCGELGRLGRGRAGERGADGEEERADEYGKSGTSHGTSFSRISATTVVATTRVDGKCPCQVFSVICASDPAR